MATTRTFSPSQIASMEKLKASNAQATPGAMTKVVTPGLKVTAADYTQAKAGGIATPASDLEAARIAYDRSQQAPMVPNPADKAKTDFVTKTSSSEVLTGGSDNIRNQMAQTSTQAGGLYNDLIKAQDNTVSDSQKRLAELDKQLASLNVYSNEELAQAQSAGDEAAAKYDPLIAEAQQSYRQGLAKANVGAGEHGGFMNTQFAGQAALTPTEGGNFVGAGGELSRIKGTLENNIQQLQVAQSTARTAAIDAAKKAIRTGKQEDLQIAQGIYDRAQKASQMLADNVNQRIDVINKIQTSQRDAVTFRQEQEDRALKQLDTISKVGGDITQDMVDQIDSIYGPGFTEDYANVTAKAAQAKTEEDALDAADKLVGILSKIPEGTELPINGAIYTGMKVVDPKLGVYSTTKTDSSGNVTQVLTKLNPETGKLDIISSVSFGRIDKGSKSGGGGNSAGSYDGANDTSKKGSFNDWLGKQPDFVRSMYSGDDEVAKQKVFEQYKNDTGVYVAPKEALWEKEAEARKQLAENPDLSYEDKAAWLESQGLDPNDFDI